MFLSNEGSSGGESDISQFPFDLQTQLLIGPGTDFYDNWGVGRHLYVGPHFKLTLNASTEAGTEPLNASSVCVTWRKRVCGKGEYVAPSGFCEQCAAFTYQMSEEPHRNDACKPAPNNTHAPGGAILVPLTSNWHMVHPRACINSTTGMCANVSKSLR
jgi:hypothetical protein